MTEGAASGEQGPGAQSFGGQGPGAAAFGGRAGDSAFAAAVGLELDEVGPERVVGHMVLGPQHHQPYGIVHGGVYCAAVEAAGSIGAAMKAMERDLICVGVHNSTHFVTAISEGTVDVVAEPIVQGRTQQLWSVEIRRRDDGRLVATGQLRVQNIEPREPR